MDDWKQIADDMYKGNIEKMLQDMIFSKHVASNRKDKDGIVLDNKLAQDIKEVKQLINQQKGPTCKN